MLSGPGSSFVPGHSIINWRDPEVPQTKNSEQVFDIVRKATMTTPNAMPAKRNGLHLQILSGLLDNKTTHRTELRVKKDHKVTVVDPQTREKYQLQTYKDVPVKVEIPTLAGNVSELNVERAAERWVA